MSKEHVIIILDFELGRTIILDYDMDKYSECEQFFEDHEQLSINNCEYMVAPKEGFNIQFSL